MKKANMNFITLQANTAELKKDKSDPSDSDGDSHADSFFLMNDNHQGL